MRIYLAGKMKGLPHFNRDLFFAAAAPLKERGHEVFNPAEYTEHIYGPKIHSTNLNGDEKEAIENFGFNRRQMMAIGMAYICLDADVLVLLPGWEQSSGACAEKALAESLPIPVLKIEDFT